MKREKYHFLFLHGNSILNLTLSNRKKKIFLIVFRNDEKNPEGIDLLKASGMKFESLKVRGIDHQKFAELFTCSGTN